MDHYQTLGVAKTATPDEIKKAYRKLASQHHPDKGGDTAMFQKIEEAYRILSDPNQRQQYDNPQRPFNFQDFGQGAPGGFSFHTNGAGFDDIFAQFFKQASQQQRPQQQVYRTTVTISLEQVYTGGEQTLRLQTPNNTHLVKVEVPRGIQDSGQLRLDNVIPNASLIVEFRVQKHLKFDRSGNDLVCNHSISVLDLIVGTTFEFTTLGGKTLEVTVKPKTQPYMQLKIANQGLPIVGNPNAYGDQIILLKPFIPDIIDSRIIDSIMQSKT